jgi:pimeloyl-ACP methyl ester carboxylesterase
MKERSRIVIDKTSTLDSFNDPSIRNVVVFVHGIFGDSEETWGVTPLQLVSSPIFTAFDYASYGYGSKFIELRDPELFVDQLILWIRTNLCKYENIYFVAHSMGGLFVRHAISKMLVNADDRALTKKIRRCFMIASPVSGSWVAEYLGWVPFLNMINKRIAYLANPSIDGKDMSAAYTAAAAVFRQAGGTPADIPRFHYFVGVDDSFVSPSEDLFFTEFDKYEGAIEGTHSTLKQDKDANSVLIKSITQSLRESLRLSEEYQRERISMVKEVTRKREIATQKMAGQAHLATTGVGIDVVDVVLISCSATKSDAQRFLHPKGGGIVESVDDARIGQLVLDMRSRVLRLIQEGSIDGIEFAQGNRASMPANRNLLFGPDFGGAFNDAKYLPAYARYTGRCYQAHESEWEAMYDSAKHPHFLIMSGLYGLIPATEYIQNYDVHLTDVDLSNGLSLQTYWRDRELMTQVLISHLEWIERERGVIGHVVDALSELSYQETINWSLIDRRWNVLHRVFELNAGRDALGNLGYWLQDIIQNSTLLRSIQSDTFYENPRFHPKDRIAFENQIGRSSLAVAREVNQ